MRPPALAIRTQARGEPRGAADVGAKPNRKDDRGAVQCHAIVAAAVVSPCGHKDRIARLHPHIDSERFPGVQRARRGTSGGDAEALGALNANNQRVMRVVMPAICGAGEP